MRSLLIVVIIAGLPVAGWLITHPRRPQTANPPVGVSSTPVGTSSQEKEINVGGNNYTYVASTVEATGSYQLINNLETKKSAKQLMSENGCRFGVNAGFYDTNNKPLGLLVIDGKTISGPRTGDLFNGYVAVTERNKMQLSTKPPEIAQSRYVSQTGPVLVVANAAIALNLSSDKPARRMIAAEIDGSEQRVAFAAIMAKNAVLDGPTLAELPQAVLEIAKNEGWREVRLAVNLDGGSASAFYSPDATVEEWTPVGSWWCVK